MSKASIIYFPDIRLVTTLKIAAEVQKLAKKYGPLLTKYWQAL